jgi:hypothetical protein
MKTRENETTESPPFESVLIVKIPAKEFSMAWCDMCKRLVSTDHTQDSCALNIATDVMKS